MADISTSLSITTADSNGKQTTRKYTAINPTLTNAEMKTAFLTLHGLTGNDYVDGSRVMTVNLDDEYPEEVTGNG